MKSRSLLIVLSLGILVATLAMVGRQHQQLSALHSQAGELQLRADALTSPIPEHTDAPSPVVTVTQSGPSLELLQLRSQVGQLERRKQELSGVIEENQRLQTQLKTKPADKTGSMLLPAGYIRRSEAKFAGFGSPEDSLQSFLWAIQQHDLQTLMKFFGPEQAGQIAAEVERRGSVEEFFKGADVIPGFHIVGREQKDDGTIVMSVQFIPGDESSIQKMQFKQFDGQWRLMSGF